MNFCIETIIGDEKLSLVLATEIGGKFYSVKEIMSVSSLSNTIYISSKKEFDLPFLITEDPSSITITTLYNIFKSKNYSLTDQEKEVVCSAMNKNSADNLYTYEVLDSLAKCAKEFDSYMQGNTVKIKMSMAWYYEPGLTSVLVEKINSSCKSESIYIEGDNRTITRSSAEEELFIKVPEYDELLFAGIPISDIQLPYEDLRFDGFNFWDDKNSVSMSEDQIEEKRKELRLAVNGPGYLNLIPENFDTARIVGDPKNNKLPIQPNEMRYRKALESLLDFGIERENKDLTLEEAKELINERSQRLKSGQVVENDRIIGSKRVKDYFTSLAQVGIYLNWSHTGLVPVSILDDITDDSDSEDDDSSVPNEESDAANEKKDATSSRIFSGITADTLRKKGDYKSMITNLILEVYLVNPYDVIDILIRLFRFGKTKPDRLEMPDGRYFDMNQQAYRNSSGTYDSTEIVYDEEGNSLYVIGRIDYSASILDKRYSTLHGLKGIDSVGMPVGLICSRFYKDCPEPQVIYMSMIDLIKAYQKDDKYCKISGISYSGGKFHIGEDVRRMFDDPSLLDESSIYSLQNCVTNVKKSSMLEYYCYDSFEDAFMAKTCFDRTTSILSIITKYYNQDDLSLLDLLAFESIEELEERVKDNLVPVKSCIEANVARIVIPILSKVNASYNDSMLEDEGMGLEELINEYDMKMSELDFREDFYVIEEDKKEVKPLTSSNNFTKNSEEEKSNGGYDALKELTTYNLEGFQYSKIIVPQEIAIKMKERFKDMITISVNTVNGSSVVGIIGTKDNSSFVFMNPKSTVTLKNSVLKFNDLCPALMDNVKAIFNKQTPKFRFEDESVGAYYSELAKCFLLVSASVKS